MMSAQLATLACFLCIFYLFKVDREKNNGVSGAVWIPLIWMFFSGSHFASQWLNLGHPEDVSAETYSEGSPLDGTVFLVLILVGIWVLRQRRVDWPLLLTRNVWILLFFLFAAISSLWADDPFVSLKRWVKGFGNLVMALIIVTEQRPDEALGFVLRRLGFVLLPLSVLFIKYYPELGRGYHMGMPMFSGATYGKNALGQLCLIIGIYFFWELILRHWKPVVPSGKQLHYSVHVMILPMTAWLLYMANSATALSCMIIAVCFLLVVRLPAMVRKPRRIFSLGLVCVVVFALLESLFHIKKAIILMLGRRPDLTDRDIIWKLVLSMQDNPLLGAGYESFWTGERLIKIWQHLRVQIIQAHNGYIELYLNLGIVGLVLLICSIISGLGKVRKDLETEYAYAVLKITLIVIILVYNYTEAMFVPVSNLFVLLFISILEVHNQKNIANQQLTGDNITTALKSNRFLTSRKKVR